MKKHFGKRGLAALLSVWMVVSLFTVCSFGVMAEAGTRELAIQTWNAASLAEAATAVGTKNSHDSAIFTTYTQTIGRRSTQATGYFIHNARVEHVLNEELRFYDGMTATLIVRLIADEGFDSGTLCELDVSYELNNYPDQYKYPLTIDYDDYEAVPTEVDPVYGYEYKEFSMTFDMAGEIFDDPTLNSMEIRATSKNNDYSTTIYSLELIDIDDNVLAKYEGESMATLPGSDGTYEAVVSDLDTPAGIVSYIGYDDGGISWRMQEPYTLYNGDGQKALGYPGLVLVDGLGAKLNAGNYSFSFEQSTMYSCGVKKATYVVMDADTNEEITRLAVDKTMVDATVGSDSGAFETRSVNFTVPEERAGHKFNFQILVFNQTDYKLHSASLNLVVDADATAPADAQAVIDAITNLDIADAQAVANARTAYNELDTLGQAWVGSKLASKLASYEKALSDGALVIEAINGLGSKDDINDTNYTEKTEALKSAESLYKDFVKANGNEIAQRVITNAQALTDYRAAYDAAEALAEQKVKEAAIQEVVDTINAIGSIDEFDETNVEAKQALVDAAETAANALISTYGQEVTAEVSNYATIEAAKTKIAEILAVPEYTLGKVNGDDNIDASDALMALQHSVKLTTLEDNTFKAADVDGNETVDATDALYILQYSVKLIEKFPAEK